MLYNYSVTPLKEDHFEERVADMCDMVERGVITMPLFMMLPLPEGDPVWDKLSEPIALYRRYRDALKERGVDCGILMQATLGHGAQFVPAPFDLCVKLADGETRFAYCPTDERFVAHMCAEMKRLAAEHPKALMIDDDYSLVMRPGKGCACPKHMAEFNRRAGTSMTREELYEHLSKAPENDPLAKIFVEVQRDSLVDAAKKFRAAIDEVDPTIRGINCTPANNLTSSYMCEASIEVNKVFAGKGNPTVIRIPNGTYAPNGLRGFGDLMCRAAIFSSKMKKNGVDVILSETDTIPFNRYAKSARYLHAHYTESMLDGLRGAKHWLTRISAYEPASGKAFRDILAKHRGLYERLADIADTISPVGLNSAFTERFYPSFSPEPDISRSHFIVTKHLQEMGIPFYFSDSFGKASFLESTMVNAMSDEEIESVFEGSVFMDATSAELLVKRGYGDRLGVTVSEWDMQFAKGEAFDKDGINCCTVQKEYKKLTVTDPETEVLSYNYAIDDAKVKLLSPAVTKLVRDGGKLSVVFCGSANVEFRYTEGFSFMNETRKAQLVSLLTQAGALPVYTPGDMELCVRAGYLPDGTLLTAVFPLGIDISDELPLYLEKEPASIRMILPDGSYEAVAYTKNADGSYNIAVRIEPMYPIILLIK